MTHGPLPRSTLITIAHQVTISVPDMSPTALITGAVNHYNRRHPQQPTTVDADPRFLARIAVNFLRHQHSSYDSTRNALRHVATADDRAFVGAIIKGRVLRAIARTYPMLADEAQRQAHREDATVAAPARRVTPTPSGRYPRSIRTR